MIINSEKAELGSIGVSSHDFESGRTLNTITIHGVKDIKQETRRGTTDQGQDYTVKSFTIMHDGNETELVLFLDR